MYTRTLKGAKHNQTWSVRIMHMYKYMTPPCNNNNASLFYVPHLEVLPSS